MDTAAAAVFGDLEGGVVKPTVQAEEGGRERKGLRPGKSSKSEAVQRSKQTANLREKIGSGRVIESENQSALALPSILSSPSFHCHLLSLHFKVIISLYLDRPFNLLGPRRQSLFPLGLHL